MAKPKDITGQKFGKLTVLSYADKSNDGHYRWHCKCDCGNELIVNGHSLRTGNTKSCGCLVSEKLTEHNFVHGLRKTPVYSVWAGIKERCFNPNNKSYHNYGERGITMYSEWINDFQAFCDYVSGLEHFGKNGYTLDRINNEGNYEPNNLRWADKKTQCRNQRKNIMVNYKGERMTLAEASERSGINSETLRNRIKAGDTSDRLFRPVRKFKVRNLT